MFGAGTAVVKGRRADSRGDNDRIFRTVQAGESDRRRDRRSARHRRGLPGGLIEAGAEVHALEILDGPDRAAAASLDRHAVCHRINLRDPDAVEALAAGLWSTAWGASTCL